MTDSSDADRLTAALRRAGVPADDSTRRRAEYTSDASNYRLVPRAVVYPRDGDDVAAVLEVCRTQSVPLTSRGGGTSVAGNAIGSGVVLDFSRHLHRVREIDPDARTATVEPGATLDAVNAMAAPHGLRFGPDPSTHARATVAGSIGNNACGSRALAYGRCADNVHTLDLMTAAGTRFTAGRGGDAGAGALGTRLAEIVRGRLPVIRTEFGRFARQVSGYSMEHLLPENGFDLAAFMAGTEGTLAVTLGATVRLVRTPAATALLVLGYPDLVAAAEAVPSVLPYRPTAVEGMDARLVEIVRRRRGPAAVPELPGGAGWLFVELAGDTEAQAVAAARELARAADCRGSAVVTGVAAAALWRIREAGAGLGGRTPAGDPAWPGWEDAAVPPDRLPEYLRDFTGLLRDHGLDGLLYGHFGDGCVHTRIDFPLADGPDGLAAFVTEAATLVARYGGSLSGEHGDGRARGELLSTLYSQAALATFAAVKDAFDPDDVLNPGVLVRPAPLTADLRLPSARPVLGNAGFAYPHDRGDVTTAVHRCVGVGACRADTTGSGGVMCPSFLATRDEKDSTRGRARVLQEMANGALITGGWRAPEVAEALDLCLSCKGCSADCPAGVDMATYKAEALYQRYRHRLRPAAHYALGWLPRWAGMAARWPGAVNAVLERPVPAKVAKRLGGIDERRPLPRFAERTFRRWFDDRPPGTGTPVLLWADTFTNHFAPWVGQAAVAVLEAAGYAVRLTDRSVCCGLTWVSTGQLDGARRRLLATFAALEPALREGIPIVGLEPSCTALLRSDAPELLPDDPRAERVAAATHTLAELLTATPGWQPPRLDGVDGIAQPHCHQHAVLGWDTDRKLLAAAGARIDAVGGCCGLAGNFGVERGHYDVSVAVAETALLPAVRAAGPDATILADGFSCRTQLAQLAAGRAVHLAELLAGGLRA